MIGSILNVATSALRNNTIGGAIASGGRAVTEERQREDVQLGYMWEVGVIGDSGYNRFEDNIVSLYALNCTIPPRSVEDVTRKYMGTEVAHPGFENSPKVIRITFWDDGSLMGYRYFSSWFNQMSDPQYGRQVSADKIKRKLFVALKDRSDVFVNFQMEFTGCYINSIGEVSMTYEESAPFRYNVSFKYDSIIYNGKTYDNPFTAFADKPLFLDILRGKANDLIGGAVSAVTSRVQSAVGTATSAIRGRFGL